MYSNKRPTLALVLVGLSEYKRDIEVAVTIRRDAVFLNVSVLQVNELVVAGRQISTNSHDKETECLLTESKDRTPLLQRL